MGGAERMGELRAYWFVSWDVKLLWMDCIASRDACKKWLARRLVQALQALSVLASLLRGGGMTPQPHGWESGPPLL